MQTNLARTLVQRGVIRKGTVLESYQMARGLSCVCDSHKLDSYIVIGAKATADRVTFETVGADRERYRIPSEYVQTLDGMQVKRVAASHRLNEDGTDVVKAKRSRATKKPKPEPGINSPMITVDLLPPMGEVINVTGDPVKAAGWYGHTNGLHTVAIRVLNFQGRVLLQATLAPSPTDSDWFSALPGGVPFVQYPQRGYIVQIPTSGETSTYGFNIESNIMWMRALVQRDYIIPSIATPPQIMAFGVVDYIRVSYGAIEAEASRPSLAIEPPWLS